jgi:hypothetical protein
MSELPPPPPPPPGAVPPPPPPQGWTGQQWYSLQGVTNALVVLLWCAIAVSVVGIFAYVNRINVINDILDSSGGDIASRADNADSFVSVVVILLSLLTLAIAILLIIWTFRAMKNAEYNGRYGGRFTPGWGIAGWLIPCANLVIPVLIFQDLWRGSDPEVPRGDPGWRRARGSALVGWWWGTYLLSAFRFGLTSNEANTRSELRDLRNTDSVAIVGMLSSIIAAILLMRVLRHIVARQEVVRDRMY